jgi:hypothetical protein
MTSYTSGAPVRAVFSSVFCAAVALAQGPTLSVPSQHATIQAAIVAAPSPATILVDPGTYSETVDLLGKQLQLVAVAGPAVTVIDGASGNDAVVTANSGETLAACVKGFTLTGGAGKPFPSTYGFDHYGGGVYVGGGSSLCVEGCWIVDNGIGTGTFAGGVYSGGAGSHADVRGCLIAGNHAWASGGATLVDGNATMHLSRCTVHGNTANSWAFGHQGGVSMANGGDVTLVDCIVWGNAGFQIKAFGGIYSNGTSALCTYSCVQGGFSGVGNIAVDPQFVSAVAGDFSLQASSPCVDAGDPASAPDPDGTRADMGSFYFSQGAVVTATATAYGAGCGSPALTIAPTATAVVGQSLGCDVTNTPTPLCLVALGASDTNVNGAAVLPFDLSAIGMPGCMIYQSTDIFGLGTTGNYGTGQATFSLAIPSNPLLVDQHFYFQAISYAPGVNALESITSNGIDFLIGNQ